MAKSKTGGLVYSTDPNYRPDEPEVPTDVSPQAQKLRLRLEKRNGKPTTVIAGFAGSDTALEALAKLLKTKAGTGGSAKDGLILIQGDVREKCIGWLKAWGAKDVK
jgi:translation initiation factor 1